VGLVFAILVAAILFWLVGHRASPSFPHDAYVASVRACDVEDARVLCIKVLTPQADTNVPIQSVALAHCTLSTFCRWVDATNRTVIVEADGYEPRRYEVSGSRDIIAVLYRRE